jgi:hypothetical protein
MDDCRLQANKRTSKKKENMEMNSLGIDVGKRKCRASKEFRGV